MARSWTAFFRDGHILPATVATRKGIPIDFGNEGQAANMGEGGAKDVEGRVWKPGGQAHAQIHGFWRGELPSGNSGRGRFFASTSGV
jgi:hypothetical protein